MRRAPRGWAAVGAVALALGAGACGSDEPVDAPLTPAGAPAQAHDLDVETVARGLTRPTQVSAVPGTARRLWVVEQTGRVVELDPRRPSRRTTVVDLTDRVVVGGEQGLLGLAFHPGFADNGRFYVNFTDRAGDTRVVELVRGPDGTVDPDAGRELLFVDQPEENHNGGSLVFAGDGALLVGMGDGGGAFDGDDLAQSKDSLLGKVLRLDVETQPAPRPQVLLAGLRNPWRMWIDPAMNELYIGDVGQDSVEEVSRVLYQPDELHNLGWPRYEGDREFPDRELQDWDNVVQPVATYAHEDGACSVTGGVVYRGAALEALVGRYVYADFCTGELRSFAADRDIDEQRLERTRIPQVTHIGTDADGELLFTTAEGKVLRAVAPEPAR